MKKVVHIRPAPAPHWVGDGFRVHALFTHESHGQLLSPFLMLDYGAPHVYAPSRHARGVGSHPHRGFETVTIAYEGEVSHLDSTGNGGTIGPGDVQWMTAGRGIVHQEFHSDAFSQKGGTMHMAQLWVNLPARAKMMPPAYQGIVNADIPTVELQGGAVKVRVIAGTFSGQSGPAQTQTPMWVLDVHLRAGADVPIAFPANWSAACAVLSGAVQVNDSSPVTPAQLVVLTQEGEGARIQAMADSHLLLLSGEPIQEPIVGYGPFVMNTRQEIIQAIEDFNAGRFGQLPA